MNASAAQPDRDDFLRKQQKAGHRAIELGFIDRSEASLAWKQLQAEVAGGNLRVTLVDLLVRAGILSDVQALRVREDVESSVIVVEEGSASAIAMPIEASVGGSGTSGSRTGVALAPPPAPAPAPAPSGNGRGAGDSGQSTDSVPPPGPPAPIRGTAPGAPGTRRYSAQRRPTTRRIGEGTVADSRAGTVIADCKLLQLIGAGNMGEVWLALNLTFGSKVAIKLLPKDPPPPQGFVERFYREARALSQVNHPGIVRVHDVGEADEHHYIKMQFIEAPSLEQIVRANGPAPTMQVLHIIRDIANAMAAAHEVGILHRDLKPANVLFVESTEELKVIDFGLARLQDSDDEGLTIKGQIMGTPKYMAPEQALGTGNDPRSDIYSLGSVAFYLLTAEPPFTGRSAMQILMKKRKEGPRDLRELAPTVPETMVRFVDWLMDRDVEARPQTMVQVRDTIDHVLAAGTGDDDRHRMANVMRALRTIVSTGDTSISSPDTATLRLDETALAQELHDVEASFRSDAPPRDWSLRIDPAGSDGRATWLRELDDALDGVQTGSFVSPPPGGTITRTVSSQSDSAAAAGSDSSAGSGTDTGIALPKRLGLAETIALGRLQLPDDGDGTRLGGYTVQHKIGEGGMGEILGVRDPDLNREVAMKVLRAGRRARQSQIDKFLIEAQVTGQLEHPNIVPVHDLGIGREGRVFFTMKYVRGRSLLDILKELKHRRDNEGETSDSTIPDFTLHDLLDVFGKVCDAVAFAHSRGVIHRDLKPDNIMVGEFGEVQVMDWGLAKVIGVEDRVASQLSPDGKRDEPASGSTSRSDEPGASTTTTRFFGRKKKETRSQRRSRGETSRLVNTSSSGGDTSQLFPPASASQVDINLDSGEIGQLLRSSKSGSETHTLDGTVMGTPAYMPPEQALGQVSDIDERSDIYSLGAILYHIITLELPFEVGPDGVMAVLFRVSNGELTPPSERNAQKVSPELEAVVLKAMSKERGDRYQSVMQVHRDIRAWQEGFTLSAMDYSTLHRLSKWVKRNRLVVSAVAAVIIVAVGVLVGVQQWQASERATRVAALMKSANDLFDQANAARKSNDLDTATTWLDQARETYSQVLALDVDHRLARTAQLDVITAQTEIRVHLEETARAREADAERRAIAERERQEAAERARDAAEKASNAQQLLDEADTELTGAIEQIETLDGAQLTTIRATLVTLFESAIRDSSRAEELQPRDRDIRQLAIDAVRLRDASLARFDRVVALRAQRADASAALAAARDQLDRGQHLLLEIDELAADAAALEGDAQAVAKARLDTKRGEAFSGLLSALNRFRSARALFSGLPDTEPQQASTVEGERASLLALTRHAMDAGQFQLANTWLREAESVVAEGETVPQEVQATRTDLDRRWSIARGYGEALSAGDRMYEAGNYDAAIVNYQLARSRLDTPDVRERLVRASFARLMAAADQARRDQRWTDAMKAYRQARDFATDDAERKDQLEYHVDELVRQATADLLGRARAAMEEGTEASLREATRLVVICLGLAPDLEEAVRLRRQLAAVTEAPDGFIYVPGGRATVGSPNSGDRNPSRAVSLEPFYISIRELTVGEYRAFVEAGGYQNTDWWDEDGLAFLNTLAADERRPLEWETQTTTPGQPVVGISAFEAAAYCRWMAAESGRPCRLPTDPEWEVVARHTPADRAGVGRMFPWGDSWVTGGLDARRTLAAVGSNPADRSGFGCLDMGGNATEWVIRTPDTEGGEGDGNGAASPVGYGVRGASSRMRATIRRWFASTTKRGFAAPSDRSPMVGFRVVRPLQED